MRTLRRFSERERLISAMTDTAVKHCYIDEAGDGTIQKGAIEVGQERIRQHLARSLGGMREEA